MRPPFPKLLQSAAVMGGALALVVSTAGYAGAEHTDTSVMTEDTDHNDGDTPDNVADDGDNAHPSGKDRSVEAGGSGNQGNAQSDPDDDGRGPDRSNGGADQPDGPGGTDLADQDGNNGCGNDDDFEDDNEGLCRDGAPGQQDEETEVEVDDEETEVEVDDDEEDNVVPTPDNGVTPDETPEAPTVEVEDNVVVNPGVSPAVPAAPASPGVSPAQPAQPAVVLASAATPAPQVLGSQVTRSSGALAATGDSTTNLVPFGLGLVLLGFAIQRTSARRLGAARTS